MNCPNCGATIQEGASLCDSCGAKLSTHSEPPQEGEARPLWMKRAYELRWIILAYLVASAVCMCCACLLGYRTNWILWQLGLR